MLENPFPQSIRCGTIDCSPSTIQNVVLDRSYPMNSGVALLLAFGIGLVAGLRSLTAPAVVAWAAHLGWLNLRGSSLAFMGSTTAVALFSFPAIGELIADKLPMIGKRTAPAPLMARIVPGGLCGACLCAAGGK